MRLRQLVIAASVGLSGLALAGCVDGDAYYAGTYYGVGGYDYYGGYYGPAWYPDGYDRYHHRHWRRHRDHDRDHHHHRDRDRDRGEWEQRNGSDSASRVNIRREDRRIVSRGDSDGRRSRGSITEERRSAPSGGPVWAESDDRR